MPEGNAAGGNGQAPAQPASPASGNGQAPTTPQANNNAAPQGGAQNGQAPTAINEQTTIATSDWKRLQQELAESRRDAAKYRDDLAKQVKAAEDAKLTVDEKRERDLADMQTKTLDQELRLQRLTLENAGYRLGPKLGIADIGAALALVQNEHEGEIDFDDKTHQPKNLEKLLLQVVKDHPVLAGQQQRPPASSGGATNPGAGNARTGVITRATYASMSPADRIARNKEVQEILRQNGGRLPD